MRANGLTDKRKSIGEKSLYRSKSPSLENRRRTRALSDQVLGLGVENVPRK